MNKDIFQKIKNIILGHVARSSVHFISFAALIVVRTAINNPILLHGPLMLFLSIISLLYIGTENLLNLQRSLSLHSFLKKILLGVDQESQKSISFFFNVKSFFMFSSNISIIAASAAILMLPSHGVALFIGSLLAFHTIYLLRDYLNTQQALDFIGRWFKLSVPSSPRPSTESTFRSSDSERFFAIGHNLDPSILDKHQLSCHLYKILPDLDQTPPSYVMRQPTLLTHRITNQEIWADQHMVIQHIFHLDDYIVSAPNSQPPQDKVNQIRSTLFTMEANLASTLSLQEKIRKITSHADFHAYAQAISSTQGEPLSQQSLSTPQQESPHIIHRLREQKETLLSYCQNINFPVDDSTTSSDLMPTYRQDSDLCSITGTPPNIPLKVTLHNRETNKATHEFSCDMLSLLQWLDNDPSNFEESSEKIIDKEALNALINHSEPPLPLLSTQQIRDVQSKLSDTRASNPIALLLLFHADNCSQALTAMLDSDLIRSRLHSPDLIKTLSSDGCQYFSLSHYLIENNLVDIHDLIIEKCYSNNTSSPIDPLSYLHLQPDATTLLCKRWPMQRTLLLSPETHFKITLDLQKLEHQHEHAEKVICEILEPRARSIQEQVSPYQEYYVSSDHEFSRHYGEALTPEKILSYSLFSDRTNISPIPLGRETMMPGVHLHSPSPTASSPNYASTPHSFSRSSP